MKSAKRYARREPPSTLRSSDVPITEKEFQGQVIELLKLHSWRVYHTFDSRRSAPGFPDLIAIRGEKLLAIEVKTTNGTLTKEQREWLAAFDDVRDVMGFILRPAANLDELELLLR